MIIDANREVVTNLSTSKEFSIAEDASMIFTMLSNFLYTEKERSVITELCSNAVDAHALVGKESTPIQVTLPTSLQKEFRVRDFGPGLSEENIYNFLTKYGSSSKSGSNNFIGGFGIGSKSPAAVTDSWTINSHNGGKYTSYLVHINDRGVPSINKLFQKETVESGIEVIIPTKSHEKWHSAATEALKYYDVQPDVRGTLTPFQKAEWVYKNELFYIPKESNNLSVLINKRLYKVNTSHIKSDKFVKNLKYVLPFETGVLSISLSREDLQYDKKTIEAINERIEKVYQYLNDEWKNTVSPITDSVYKYKMEAIKFSEKYCIRNLWVGEQVKQFACDNNDVLKDDADLDSLSIFKVHIKNSEPDVKVVCGGKYKVLTQHSYSVGQSDVKIGYDGKWVGDDYVKKYFISFNFVRDSICFLLNDAHATIQRAKHHMEKNPSIKTIVILEKDEFDLIPEEFEKIKSSDLEKPVIKREKKEISVVVNSPVYVAIGNRFIPISESDVNKTNAVCLKFKKANSIGSMIDEHVKFYNSFKDCCQIYFVRESEEIPDGFLSPEEFVKSLYDANILKFSEIENWRLKVELMKHKSYYGSFFELFIGHELYKSFKTPSPSILNEVRDEILNIQNSKTNLTNNVSYNILVKCCEYLGVQIPAVKEMDFDKRLYDAYPMLRCMGNQSYDSKSFQMILEYVVQCGK